MMSVKRWAWTVSFLALFTSVSWAVDLPQTAAELAAMDTTALDEDAQFALWALAAQKGWSWQTVSTHLNPHSVNAQGRNIAHLAARFGRTDWLGRLPVRLLKQPDDTDNQPIHSAAWAGQLKAVRWLVEHGADLTAINRQQWQPLHMALFNQHEAVVRWLIEQGAPVNAVTREGWTPLGLAITQGACNLIPLLRQAGANVYQTIRAYGRELTPLALAQIMQASACISALR